MPSDTPPLSDIQGLDVNSQASLTDIKTSSVRLGGGGSTSIIYQGRRENASVISRGGAGEYNYTITGRGESATILSQGGRGRAQL